MTRTTLLTALAAALVGVLSWAPGALAANWLKNDVAGTSVRNVSVGGFVTNVPVSATDNSPPLFVGGCENFDALYFRDPDGDTDNTTITLTVEACASDIADDTSATVDEQSCWPIENLTLDGIVTTNTEAIYGASAVWIYVNAAGVNDTAFGQLIIKCNGPRP